MCTSFMHLEINELKLQSSNFSSLSDYNSLERYIPPYPPEFMGSIKSLLMTLAYPTEVDMSLSKETKLNTRTCP